MTLRKVDGCTACASNGIRSANSALIACGILLSVFFSLGISEADESLPKYRLRYQFQPGEVIRWKVTQWASVKTTIQGHSQDSRSRSVSTKVWQITHSGSPDKTMFIHSVEDADMWQQVSDRPEVRYNSRTDASPPAEYAMIQHELGVPLVTVTMDDCGQILARHEYRRAISPTNNNAMVLPLPEEPIGLGHSWTAEREVPVNDQHGLSRRIKTRRRYTLLQVKTGVAEIGIEHQVLSPVNDPSIEAQLIQEAAEGTLKFDIDAGRVLSQRLDLDKRIIGFQGPASSMRYVGRLVEEILPTEDATAKGNRTADSKPSRKREDLH